MKPYLHLMTVHTIDVDELMPPAIYTTLASFDMVGNIVCEHRAHLTNKGQWWRIYREHENEPVCKQKMAYKWLGEKDTYPEIYYDTLFVVHLGIHDTILDVDHTIVDQLTEIKFQKTEATA